MTTEVTTRWSRPELTYCSNVHAGESFREVLDTLESCLGRVRELRGLEVMSTGLWLANDVARELAADPARLGEFSQALQRAGIQLRTVNGFPYGGFHDPSVKQGVYQPDWASEERYQYTWALARVLANCLPDDEKEGSISTLPLGLAADWTPELHERSLAQLCRISQQLSLLQQQTGRSIRICLEMEPGCVLESTAQVIRFFTEDLPAAAHHQGIDGEFISRHLGVCFDVCHQAVMFEDPFESLAHIRDAGIVVGKIQLSNALELPKPQVSEARDALARFAEPRYVHQVRTRLSSGQVQGVMDLPDALSGGSFPDTEPWRIHFHVPVQAASVENGDLITTRSAICRTLDFLRAEPLFYPHLEIETYTWDVLPVGLRPTDRDSLLAGLLNELEWMEQQMNARGLLER